MGLVILDENLVYVVIWNELKRVWWVEELWVYCWVWLTLQEVTDGPCMSESSVSVFLDREWVEELLWSLRFVSVELWVVCLSICNSKEGDLWDGREFGLCSWCDWVDWVEELILLIWCVEGLLNVCRVDITLLDVTEWIRVMIGGSSEWMGWRTPIHMTHSWWVEKL